MKFLVILKKRIFTNKSVSLLELLITLGIMIILLTMISNVFVEVMRINILNKERTFVREESAILLAQIKKDIRNSDRLISCAGVTKSGDSSNDCRFALSGKTYEWKFEQPSGTLSDFANDGYIAKKYIVTTDPVLGVSYQLIYTSPEGILFDLDPIINKPNNVFTVLTNPTNQDGQLTVVIKLIAKSFPGEPLAESAVKNVIKQTIVSARNFISN